MRRTRSSGVHGNAVVGPAGLLSTTVNRIWRSGGTSANSSPTIPATELPSHDPDYELAQRMQIQELEKAAEAQAITRRFQNIYDAEDRQLRRQHAELTGHIQVTFRCGVCFDDFPEDDAATVDNCSHTMCRSCLRDFVCSKIQEHRFPIMCPLCTAIDKNPNPAVISRSLVEQIGITEEQYQVWIEMELAQFSVFIQCRKCNGSAFVDRQDHEEMPIVMCPEQDCDHIWCKACQQTIVIGGPKHSCDGTTELDHLMKEKGWKYCPNCKTPIQKDLGCNHMTCISPGCNSHFCYVCGGLIVQSAVKDEINRAVSAHYERCQLFDVAN